MVDIFTVLGTLGVILVLLAYLGVSFHVFLVKSYSYVSLNFVGACLLGLDSYNKDNFSAIAINVIWIVVAIVTTGSIIKQRRFSKGKKKVKK